jgi:hypothetical protein
MSTTTIKLKKSDLIFDIDPNMVHLVNPSDKLIAFISKEGMSKFSSVYNTYTQKKLTLGDKHYAYLAINEDDKVYVQIEDRVIVLCLIHDAEFPTDNFNADTFYENNLKIKKPTDKGMTFSSKSLGSDRNNVSVNIEFTDGSGTSGTSGTPGTPGTSGGSRKYKKSTKRNKNKKRGGRRTKSKN